LRRHWFKPNGERTGNGDREVGLPRSGSADEDHVALVGDEAAGREIADQGFVDRGPDEVELVDILGKGQLGDGQLVADRPGLLLGDLRLEQIAHDARRLMLALDARGHDLVIGTAHPVELQRSHQVEDVCAVHGGWFS
jgi:hypothetical protein